MTAIETPQGRIVGSSHNGVRALLGIPYATARRFEPPDKPTFHGELDATRFGPAAPQNPDKLDTLWGAVLAPGAEECLTLNIWAPEVVSERCPVVVWIPGGAFFIGGSAWPYWHGEALCRGTGAIVVTINYRLGALGFLDLSEFGPGHESSCNLGILDQIAALEWVHNYIALFGGDPERVTLGGQSAGAISVSCLAAIPRARRLFQQMICMSGAPTVIRPPDLAKAVTRKFCRRAKVDSVEGLRKLPVAEVLRIQNAVIKSTDFGEPQFAPTYGTELIPRPPLHDLASLSDPKRILLGYTRDEFRLWGLYVPILRTLHAEALRPWLQRLVGSRADALLQTYRECRPESTPGDQSMAILGDVIFSMPVVRLAEATASAGQPTYVYRLDWATQAQGGWLGSPHALDTPLLFGNQSQPGAREMIAPIEASEKVTRAWQASLAAFLRTGVPTTPAGEAWMPYNVSQRKVMRIDERWELLSDPGGAEHRTWDGVPFDGVHPDVTNFPTQWELLRFLLTRLLLRRIAPLLLIVIVLVVILKIAGLW